MKITWQPGPAQPVLTPDDVHVWCIDLDSPTFDFSDGCALLSPDEMSRADRFAHAKHRQRHVAAHATLRLILNCYTGIPPRDLQFVRNAYGKPALSGLHASSASRDMQFSLSHSECLCLIAIASQQPVGVDVERCQTGFEWRSVAERFFSPTENSNLNSIPSECQYESFLNGWTRKEAYLKAIGTGLFHPLDTFDVTLAPNQPAALLAVRTDRQEISGWRLQSLHPARDYVGALAVRKEWFRLSLFCWTWSPVNVHPAS